MRWSLRVGVRLILAVALGLGASACPGGPDAQAPRRPLPSYDRHAQELFDDVVEPRAAGISLDEPNSPHADMLLRERTQVGDAVLRAVVTTVTSKQEDTGTTYQLGLRSVAQLAGKHPPDGEFTLKVDKNSPSVGILRTLVDQIVGKRFTAFVRAFVRPDGDQEVHFHLAPDEPEVHKAVHQAALLQELK